jgi:hypothetical protein
VKPYFYYIFSIIHNLLFKLIKVENSPILVRLFFGKIHYPAKMYAQFLF